MPGRKADGMDPNYPSDTEPDYPGMPSPTGPQYGQPYYPPPSGQQATVVVGAPTVTVVTGGFQESPMRMKCPECRKKVLTKTSYEKGAMTWMFCGISALMGCCCGCCLIPFYVDGCKDVRHTCPNCDTYLGIYRRQMQPGRHSHVRHHCDQGIY